MNLLAVGAGDGEVGTAVVAEASEVDGFGEVYEGLALSEGGVTLRGGFVFLVGAAAELGAVGAEFGLGLFWGHFD